MIDVQDIYKPIYTTEKPIILLTGGRGGAKSFNAQTFTQRLTFEKGHVILITRYTMTSAEKSIIPEFNEKIVLEGTDSFFRVNKDEIKNTYSGSRIMFSGIKTSSGNQTARLKSIVGLTTFIVDEAEEWESEEEYDTIRLSIRKKGVKNRVVIILNPTNIDHWIYKKYIEKTNEIVYIDEIPVQMSTHPDVLHIHTTYLDNAENLSKEFLNEVSDIRVKHLQIVSEINTTNNKLDKLRKENKAETHEYKEEKKKLNQLEKDLLSTKYALKIIGRWSDQSDGAIFNYKIGEFDNSLPYCYGQDYGFTIDPTTLIKLAIDEKQKKIYLQEKFYKEKSRLSTNDIFDLNTANIDNETDLIVGDSAEGRLIVELRKKGLNIVECEKGPGSVKAGILAMQDYELIVDPESTNLKIEFNNYCWNDKKAGIPMDNYNHLIDPARYAFRRLANKVTQPQMIPLNKGTFG
jgi:phage terminase large subunit